MKINYAALLFIFCVLFSLISCSNSSDNLTKKEIVALVEQNSNILLNDIQTGNFDNSSALKGILEINSNDEIIDFYCGGYGMGPTTGYYGFYYTMDDNMTAIWCSGSPLQQDGNGFSWKETDGDNRYYTEKIIDNFYYYEAHF